MRPPDLLALLCLLETGDALPENRWVSWSEQGQLGSAKGRCLTMANPTQYQTTAPPWVEYPIASGDDFDSFPPSMVLNHRSDCTVCGQGDGEHCDPVGYAYCVRRANKAHKKAQKNS